MCLSFSDMMIEQRTQGQWIFNLSDLTFLPCFIGDLQPYFCLIIKINILSQKSSGLLARVSSHGGSQKGPGALSTFGSTEPSWLVWPVGQAGRGFLQGGGALVPWKVGQPKSWEQRWEGQEVPVGHECKYERSLTVPSSFLDPDYGHENQDWTLVLSMYCILPESTTNLQMFYVRWLYKLVLLKPFHHYKGPTILKRHILFRKTQPYFFCPKTMSSFINGVINDTHTVS